jgi:hypothetical protein
MILKAGDVVYKLVDHNYGHCVLEGKVSEFKCHDGVQRQAVLYCHPKLGLGTDMFLEQWYLCKKKCIEPEIIRLTETFTNLVRELQKKVE